MTSPISLLSASSYSDAATHSIDNSPAGAVKAAREFESFFVGYVFQTAMEAIPKSDDMGGGMGNDIYSSLFVQEAATRAASGKGIGLADQIARMFPAEKEDKNSTLKENVTPPEKKI